MGNKFLEGSVVLAIVAGCALWAAGKDDVTVVEACAEYNRIADAPFDAAALVELAKHAPAEMQDDLLVLAGVSYSRESAQHASADLSGTC